MLPFGICASVINPVRSGLANDLVHYEYQLAGIMSSGTEPKPVVDDHYRSWHKESLIALPGRQPARRALLGRIDPISANQHFSNNDQAMQAGGSIPGLPFGRDLKERAMICMEIDNNGPGMDEAACKHVFEFFFRTEPVTEMAELEKDFL